MKKGMMNLVKALLPFYFFTFSPLSASAQSDWVGQWSVIPHVGINSSNMSGQEVYFLSLYENGSQSVGVVNNAVVEPSRKIGFVAGAEVEYRYMQPLSTAVGVWYSREGFRYKDVGDDAHTNVDLLNFSAVENFYVADGLAIKAGLQLGCLLGVKYYYDSYTEDAGNSYKKLNLSIPVGLSYEYRNVVLDARYNIGLTNLCDINLVTEKWRTNSFWLTLGYRFTLN